MFGNYPGIAVLQGGEDVNKEQQGFTMILKKMWTALAWGRQRNSMR